MTDQLIDPSESDDSAIPSGGDLIAPLTRRSLSWHARWSVDSPFLVHLAFTFWLIETARPRLVASTEVGDGVAYFGLCQAIDRLGLEAFCHGVETASDDARARRIADYAQTVYPDLSRIGDMRTVTARLPEGRVDVLHLELRTDDWDTVERTWMPRVSDRGIVLVSGTIHPRLSVAAQDLLDRLVATHPSISLDHGDGVTAILVGPNQPDRLLRLARMQPGDPGHAEIARLFSRLGQAHLNDWKLAVAEDRIAELEKDHGKRTLQKLEAALLAANTSLLLEAREKESAAKRRREIERLLSKSKKYI